MNHRFDKLTACCVTELKETSANSTALLTLLILSDDWHHCRIGLIADGTPLERLKLKDAYLNSVSELDTVDIPACRFADSVAGVDDEELCKADIVVVDDVDMIFDDPEAQKHLYDVAKARFSANKLTVFFSSVRMRDVEQDEDTLPELIELIDSGLSAALGKENRYEEFFFNSDFEDRLQDIFLAEDASLIFNEDELTALANFLLMMSEYNHTAGVWYALLAMKEDIPGFSEARALDLLLEDGDDSEYGMVLAELADEYDLDDETYLRLRMKPCLLAAQKALAEG